MKKKGFTMVELMVSVAVIAVVMVFLVNLLLDVKYDFTNELYNTSNQINRAEIIKTVHEDFNGKMLTNITTTGSTTDKLVLNLESNNGEATLTVNSDNSVAYKPTNASSTKKWKLEKLNSETYIQKVDIPYQITKAGDDYLVEVNIPVIIDNSALRKNNDNKLDNIILVFYGTGTLDLPQNQYLNPTK